MWLFPPFTRTRRAGYVIPHAPAVRQAAGHPHCVLLNLNDRFFFWLPYLGGNRTYKVIGNKRQETKFRSLPRDSPPLDFRTLRVGDQSGMPARLLLAFSRVNRVFGSYTMLLNVGQHVTYVLCQGDKEFSWLLQRACIRGVVAEFDGVLV